MLRNVDTYRYLGTLQVINICKLDHSPHWSQNCGIWISHSRTTNYHSRKMNNPLPRMNYSFPEIIICFREMDHFIPGNESLFPGNSLCIRGKRIIIPGKWSIYSRGMNSFMSDHAENESIDLCYRGSGMNQWYPTSLPALPPAKTFSRRGIDPSNVSTSPHFPKTFRRSIIVPRRGNVCWRRNVFVRNVSTCRYL